MLDTPIFGMLLGSLIGDAAGGPVEFLPPGSVRHVLADLRSWPKARRIQAEDLQRLESDFQLLSYESLRPDSAPLGPWKQKAQAGTITDDSRFKIILIRAIRESLRRQQNVSKEELARQIISFQSRSGDLDQQLRTLHDEGLREFRYAARWILGERRHDLARPPERQWGGVATCAGQMVLLPIAGLYPGHPEKAYRKTWELDFVDSSFARDFCAALVAGLAMLCAPTTKWESPRSAGNAFLKCVRDTDPYQLSQVPYVGRPMLQWLDLSTDIARRAQGRPAELYRLLETEGEPKYWWDAHFTFLVPLTILQFCEFHCVPAIRMCLDFGHDTDSYAQVAGAIGGAIQGAGVFPEESRRQVAEQLAVDYNEEIADWTQLLKAASSAVRPTK